MKHRQKATQEQIDKIEQMASKGVRDVEIAKELELSYAVVQKYSTRYWAKKMKKANLMNTDVKDPIILTNA